MSERGHLPVSPVWWEDALAATRLRYQRIDVHGSVCWLCGGHVHVATGPIVKGPDGKTSLLPSVYAFCYCGQSVGDLGGMSWAFNARYYQLRIAAPDSDEHRANMLSGRPSIGFIRMLQENVDLDEEER